MDRKDHLESLLENYRGLKKEIQHFRELTGLAHWDMMTGAPGKGKPIRSEAIGTLSTEAFKKSVSEELGLLLKQIMEHENFEKLTLKDRRSIEKDHKNLERFRKIPSEEYKEYVILTSKAQNLWEKAKAENDFNMFAPLLKKIVEYNRRMTRIFGYDDHPYDALLDRYEEGMTVQKLDKTFKDLKEETLKILKKMKEGDTGGSDLLEGRVFPVEKQKHLSKLVLEVIGFDFSKGRLDESVHPFTIGLNPNDVRLTTRYQEDFFKMALYGTIHEGGHGIYEQNIPLEYFGTAVGSAASTGMHESQSRFWENIVGRSEAFWKGFYPKFQEIFEKEANEISREEILRHVNRVESSPIRVEADEITYNLHIILRYELEKALIGGEIEVEELPKLWNEKMEEFLGIIPSSDKEGVLQDVHWSGGMFGYFPTYTLGNLYAAQLTEALIKEIPDFEDKLEKLQLEPLKKWMTDNVHSKGSIMTAEELLMEATGKKLTTEPFIRYLNSKYL